MDTLSYKTISMNKATVKKEWVVVDATDQVLGRLCTKVAKYLRERIICQMPGNMRIFAKHICRLLLISISF